MRSKLICFRRKMHGPIAFLILMFLATLLVTSFVYVLEHLREPEPEPDLSLCPFCGQSVQH